MEVLAKGTVEPLVTRVTDTLGNVTSLSSATFDVYTNDDEETQVIDAQVAIVDDMLIITVVDTTVDEFEEGEYKMFVNFPIGAITLRQGPFYFRVDD